MENDSIKITKIRPVADACSRLFELCLNPDAPTTDIRHQTNLQHERFYLWSSYLGVFASEKASLDKKLEFCDSVRDLIIRLLLLMQENLEFITHFHVPRSILEASDVTIRDPERELGGTSTEALSAVETVINRLNMLSSTIQRSSAATIESRVTAFTEKHGDLNYKSRARTRIDHRYRTAPPSLKEQLSASMTYRRQRLRWTHRHQRKIETQSLNERFKRTDVGRRDIMRTQRSGRATSKMSIPYTGNDTQMIEGPEEAIVHKRNLRGGIALSDTTAPSFRPTPSAVLRMKSRIAGSVVSSTHSNTLMAEDMTGYPEPPEKQEGVPHPICYYCRQPLQSSDLKHWSRHVDQDLEPFVCLSAKCNELSFNKVELWAKHMREIHSDKWPQLIHRPVMWRCEVDHPESPFECDDELLFSNHLDENHGKCSFEVRQSIVKTTQVRRKRSRNVCPLCNFDISALDPDKQTVATRGEVTSESIKQKCFDDLDRLSKHVANHLRILAFESAEYLDDQLEDGGSQGSASTSNGQRCANSEQQKLSGIEHISMGSLRISDNSPPLLGAKSDQEGMKDDGNISEISAAQETPRELDSPVDWKDVKPDQEGPDEDKILTSLIEKRAHYGMLLQTIWQAISNDDYFQLPERASEAVTRVINKLNATQPDPKSETFRSDLYKIVGRSDLEPFFDKILKVSDSVADLQPLAEYCVNQVLGGRRHLFIILVVHNSPVDVLKVIKDGVADTDLPLSSENMGLYFPSWTEDEVNTFLQYQRSLPNPNEIDDQSIVDQTQDEEASESPSESMDDEVLHKYTEHLRTRLVESVSNPGSTNHFISNSSLRRIVNEDAVRRILRSRAATRKLDTMKLENFVCKEAVRIFAILIGLRMIDCVDDFYAHRFTDEVLPVYRSNGQFTTIATQRTNSDIISAVFNGSHWTPGLQRSFCEHAQWLFLAPNFLPERFRYWFSKRTPLPFLNLTEPAGGLFECSIDQSHIKVVQGLPLDGSGNVCATLKVMKRPLAISQSVFEAAVQTEIDVLGVTRDWGNPHIIRAIAYYIQNEAHHFIYPRATGGSLHDLWAEDPPEVIDDTYLQWLFSQLCGLAGAIEVIHTSPNKVAPANLKPDNILCFGELETPLLVMSGLGLQGFQNMALKVNDEGLTNQESVGLYEQLGKTENLEAWDIWSFGWITLEFLIWLLHGSSQLWKFRRSIVNDLRRGNSDESTLPRDVFGFNTGHAGAYPDDHGNANLSRILEQKGDDSSKTTERSNWETSDGVITSVPRVVLQWIDEFGKDHRCAKDAALGKLLKLTVDRLLVADELRRANAMELKTDLKQIFDAASGDQPKVRWIGLKLQDQK